MVNSITLYNITNTTNNVTNNKVVAWNYSCPHHALPLTHHMYLTTTMVMSHVSNHHHGMSHVSNHHHGHVTCI